MTRLSAPLLEYSRSSRAKYNARASSFRGKDSHHGGNHRSGCYGCRVAGIESPDMPSALYQVIASRLLSRFRKNDARRRRIRCADGYRRKFPSATPCFIHFSRFHDHNGRLREWQNSPQRNGGFGQPRNIVMHRLRRFSSASLVATFSGPLSGFRNRSPCRIEQTQSAEHDMSIRC